MNIFYLDSNPTIAAQYHVDKHVVKMILEYAQLLSTAHRLLDQDANDLFYKATHKNHPCAIWTRNSQANYNWLWTLFAELAKEYTFRYNKIHKSWRTLGVLLKQPPKNIPNIDKFSQPPQAMPTDCRQSCSIEAYRQYYKIYKKHIANWKKRTIPPWY